MRARASRARRSGCGEARTCATPAPTPRSKSNGAPPPRCAAPSSAPTARASASSTETRRWSSRRWRSRRSAGRRASSSERARSTAAAPTPAPTARTRFFSHGAWREAGLFPRETLALGARIGGPALIVEPHQTIVVEDGWRAEITAKNHVVLRRIQAAARRAAIGTQADPVMLEIFNNLFMSIAEQMGVTLQNTAYSVNIKERLDFSCAVFDAEGRLVANAPHMPVHLGSMDRSVETVIRDNQGKIRAGDVFALNAPYNGGTHLPDITVCTPGLRRRRQDDPVLGRLARPSRRHRRHRARFDDAAARPTSSEEGVYIDNFLLVERGRFREKELTALLASGPYPARNPVQNVNDLKAQIAANEKGARELRAHGRACSRLPTVVRLYGPRAGQRRRERAARDRPAEGRRVLGRDRPGRGHQGEDHGRSRRARGDRRFLRHRRRSSRTISTRPSRWRARPCSTCSASWSTTKSR